MYLTLINQCSYRQTTEDTSNLVLYGECLKLYRDSMQYQIEQKSKDEFQPYFVKSALEGIHEEVTETVMTQVR